MEPYMSDSLYSKSPPYSTIKSPAFDEILNDLSMKMVTVPSLASADSPLGFENSSPTTSNSLGTSISSPVIPPYGNYHISTGYNLSPGNNHCLEQVYSKSSPIWSRQEQDEENDHVSAFEVPSIAEYGPVPPGGKWSKFRVGGRVSGFPLTLPVSLTMLSLSNNEITVIPDSVANMKHLTFLNFSNNLLKNLPKALGELINLETLILTNNLIESVPYDHCKLASLVTYDLTGNPLNPQMSKFYQGPECTASFISKLAALFVPETPPCPAQRHWCFNKENTIPGVPIFDVMSYNILFECYATSRQYPYCPTYALGWNYRLGKILDTIAEQSPQILALQEVGFSVFHKILLPMFEKQGYSGLFVPKSRYRSGSITGIDGSALFWKTDRFTYVQHEIVEFANASAENAIGECKEKMLNRVMPHDNVALIVVLQPTQELLDGGEVKCNKMLPIVACSTHMFWNPDFCDVKLIQTMILLKSITKIAKSVAGKDGTTDDVPILIMGDFNSLPDSGVYQYLSRGHIERTHKEFKEFVFSDLSHLCDDNDPNAYFYKHSLHLKSCIDSSKLLFTNHTSSFTGMIDYIFVNSKVLCNMGYLHFDTDWVHTNNIVGFPNEHIPSDHIPIAARLGVIDRDSKNLVENILKKAISKNS